MKRHHLLLSLFLPWIGWFFWLQNQMTQQAATEESSIVSSGGFNLLQQKYFEILPGQSAELKFPLPVTSRLRFTSTPSKTSVSYTYMLFEPSQLGYCLRKDASGPASADYPLAQQGQGWRLVIKNRDPLQKLSITLSIAAGAIQAASETQTTILPPGEIERSFMLGRPNYLDTIQLPSLTSGQLTATATWTGSIREINLALITPDGRMLRETKGNTPLTLQAVIPSNPGPGWYLKLYSTPPSNPNIIASCKGKIKISLPTTASAPVLYGLQGTEGDNCGPYVSQKKIWWAERSVNDPNAVRLRSSTQKFATRAKTLTSGTQFDARKSITAESPRPIPNAGFPVEARAAIYNTRKFPDDYKSELRIANAPSPESKIRVRIGDKYYGENISVREYLDTLRRLESSLNKLGYSLADSPSDKRNKMEKLHIAHLQRDSALSDRSNKMTEALRSTNQFRDLPDKRQILQKIRREQQRTTQRKEALNRMFPRPSGPVIRNANPNDTYFYHFSNGDSKLLGSKDLFAVSYEMMQENQGDKDLGVTASNFGNLKIYIFSADITIMGFNSRVLAPNDEQALRCVNQITLLGQDIQPGSPGPLVSGRQSEFNSDKSIDYNYASYFAVGPFVVSVRAGSYVSAGVNTSVFALPFYAENRLGALHPCRGVR
ncbi:MAG: hypothetical protein IPL65_22510 [Lewinellaceae bacterium]|nr:hypothetical protein [Lewinellaceae bacterium]